MIGFQAKSNSKPAAANRGSSGSHNTAVAAAAAGSLSSQESFSDLENTRLKSLIREIRDSMNSAKKFWTGVPQLLCKDVSQGSNDQSCWNGREAGAYTTPVFGEGLLAQESNQEVSVDAGRPDVYINEQIFALKLITKKLESAHKGQNVDWPSSTGGKLYWLLTKVNRIRLGTSERVNKGRLHRGCLDDITTPPLFSG